MKFYNYNIFLLYLSHIYGYNIPNKLWYPFLPTSQLKDIQKVIFFDEPFVCYKKNNKYIVHSDICPHQGASLSKGSINKEGNLNCPYHNFEFDEGLFCKIPPNDRIRSPIKLKCLDTQLEKDFLFVKYPSENNEIIPSIYYPPEEYDSSFRSIDGSILVNNNYMTVCENLLDMLHISYVHSFGNRVSPLPTSIKSKRLSENSNRTIFKFIPNENTISSKIGKVSFVKVENEYHLPTDTITRVYAGNIIKTVFTRSIPITHNMTLLYWKLYRNFWIDEYFPIFSNIGDLLIYLLMNQTIQEDISILNNVYENNRDGPLKVRYDITIENFRRDSKNLFLN